MLQVLRGNSMCTSKITEKNMAVVKNLAYYRSRYETWAKEGKIHQLGVNIQLPAFRSVKFSNYMDMNLFKGSALLCAATKGKIQWKKL